MSNKNAIPPERYQFKPGWRSGKTKNIKLPIALESDIKAIAQCLDRNPDIAGQVLAFAKALAEQTATAN